ncbi:MAG: S46 family peptidase, partial [Gammaproteobacteria bacterium]|nr:S46 family peptidase [Gammaproteobacteria bacterium]
MRLFPALLALLVCLNVFAAEGMWQPHQLPALGNTLRDLGLEVDPAQLNSLTEHPMAAIVGLGGCSASFVSPDGLAVTNHHCVQGSLQHNSTPERNLLELGFLAEQRSEELPGRPGSRIYVTVEVTDVTAAMLEGLDADTDGLVRQRTLETREKSLVAECERQSGFRCNVYMFYQGLEFYLIRQLEIRDVRLVYVPPRSIGAYGGDIDNWMWPRHTGDYSFLRAYVAPDGSPAEYDQDNVPYKPEHYLAVSTDGLEDGDFAMAVGYPGRTYRHRLALEAADVSNWFYPTRKQHFEEVLAIIERETRDREDAAIKYSALVQGLNNVIKNYGGMIEGFARSGLVDRKRRAEVELRTWLADNDRQDDSLAKLGTLVREYRDGREQRMIYDDFLRRRAALLSAAATLYRLSIETEKPDNERKIGFQDRDRDRIRERMTRLPRSYDPAVDQAMLVHHVEAYSALPADQRIAALDRWLGGNDAG